RQRANPRTYEIEGLRSALEAASVNIQLLRSEEVFAPCLAVLEDQLRNLQSLHPDGAKDLTDSKAGRAALDDKCANSKAPAVGTGGSKYDHPTRALPIADEPLCSAYNELVALFSCRRLYCGRIRASRRLGQGECRPMRCVTLKRFKESALLLG